MPADQTTPAFRFGVFETSRSAGLRRNGIVIKLARQPHQLLLLLLERAGQVVTREEIQKLIWPAEVVDFEIGINRCIRQIRSALRDDADAPRYLETLPRVGYRFIAPVEAFAGQRSEPTPPQSEAAGFEPAIVHIVEPPASTAGASSRPRTFLRFLPVASGLTAAIVIALWLWNNRPHLSPNLSPVPLAVFAGDQSAPTFSPDGRRLAYVWNGARQDNFDIYIKQLNSSLPPLRLTHNRDIDYSPAWSPNGEWIAFCRGTNQPGGAIWIVPSLGGVERKLIDLNVVAQPLNRTIAWTADSKDLIVTDELAGQRRKGLHIIAVETRSVRQLTEPGLYEVDGEPAVSWNNKWLAFVRTVGRGPSSILVAPLSDPAATKQLAVPRIANKDGSTVNTHPAWAPGNSHLVFVSEAGGGAQVWMSPADGSGTAQRLGALGDGIEDLAISSSGQLAFAHVIANINIWTIELQPPVRQVESDRPLLASTRLEETPSVTADGRVAFASNLSGYWEIWSAHQDDSDLLQLTSLKSLVTGSPDWSSSGNSIAFDSQADGFSRLYAMSSDGSHLRLICCKDATGLTPRWSPDGQSIYYSSNRGGRLEIWRMPASGGSSTQITKDGGFAPTVGDEGHSLYYTQSNTAVSPLWQMQITTGARKLLASALA